MIIKRPQEPPALTLPRAILAVPHLIRFLGQRSPELGRSLGYTPGEAGRPTEFPEQPATAVPEASVPPAAESILPGKAATPERMPAFSGAAAKAMLPTLTKASETSAAADVAIQKNVEQGQRFATALRQNAANSQDTYSKTALGQIAGLA